MGGEDDGMDLIGRCREWLTGRKFAQKAPGEGRDGSPPREIDLEATPGDGPRPAVAFGRLGPVPAGQRLLLRHGLGVSVVAEFYDGGEMLFPFMTGGDGWVDASFPVDVSDLVAVVIDG